MNPISILTTKTTACLVALSLMSATHKVNIVSDKPSTDSTQLKFTVEEAPEWSAMFNRTSGWFGGDGIFAMPLNGRDNVKAGKNTETIFIFSDSIIGEVKDGQLYPPGAGFKMVHNTVAYLKGSDPKPENIKFEYAKNAAGKPDHLFVPKPGDVRPDDYYWHGDGFFNTELNTLYIFGYHMRNLDKNDDWSFRSVGLNLIAIPAGSRPPFKDHRQIATPLHFATGGHFGSGIFVNTKASGALHPDGYIYVYGTRKGKLMVSRVLPKDFENFSTWRFWDGEGWNTDMQKSAYIADNVSPELSVSALPDGRYIVVSQKGNISNTVAVHVGATPYGKFGPGIDIYTCKESSQKNIFTYNAKAHPSLSAPGELLISYNVNAYNFGNEIKASPNLYRPRFIRLKIQQ